MISSNAEVALGDLHIGKYWSSIGYDKVKRRVQG